jgi:hypothetical protein
MQILDTSTLQIDKLTDHDILQLTGNKDLESVEELILKDTGLK